MIPSEKKYFVRIDTVFNGANERTVPGLRKLYSNISLLKSFLERLVDGELDSSCITGKKILLKPNWVKHPKLPGDEICLCTHDSFVLAVLELMLEKKPASIVIGDAPIQGAIWDKTVTASFIAAVQALSLKFEVPVSIKDFRRVVYYPGSNELQTERNPESDYVIFDVGKKSFLEPITPQEKNSFRVAQYNPDKFNTTHRPGVHKYCITRALFDADIVISLPKVKTHQKTGITCALKNIVGLNGDKDYLPHHRIGGKKAGGDSYPGNNLLRYWSELATDNANRNKGKIAYWFWLRTAAVLWKISMPGRQHQLNGAWHGNDTTWRMVMDLNKIVVFGKSDGTLAETPQRYLYSISDGIIGGQGDGPLHPEPLALGVVAFSNDAAKNDECMAQLMGIDVEKLPLLREAASFIKDRKTEVMVNSKEASVKILNDYSINAIMPPGWLNYR